MDKIRCKYRSFFPFAWILLALPLNAQQLAAPDTLPPAADTAFQKVRISESIDDPVAYGARDSMWFDVKNKRLHLWGNASVEYTTLNVKAGYIVLDYSINEIQASEFPDTAGQMTGLPEFQDRDQTFTANRLRYNFSSRKGMVYDARTQQEDLYVIGNKAKFIAPPPEDTTAKNTIYNRDALITTCDALVPHYGIRTSKLKVVPDKLVVTGFSNLEVAGVPTPLVLPFGFYPITKTRKAGLIIPRDFEFAQEEGFGLQNFGWYQPINDHMDLSTTFNLYTSGRFGVQITGRYNQLYKFNSNLILNYNRRVYENNQAEKVYLPSFQITWNHNQDAKAHPTRRFGGSINLQTSRNQSLNRNDFQSVYQNQMQSNLTYTQSFPGRPFQLNASFSHSQNNQTRIMNITFPRATFTMQRTFPFKRKEIVGKERWYEKISINYQSELSNSVSVVDSLLFTSETLKNSRLGVRHSASTDYNFKLFKYINVAPNVRYEENWYPYTVRRELIPQERLVYYNDTIEGVVYTLLDSTRSQFGIDTSYRDYGFKTFRTYNVGISVNTALFFTKQFRRGWFRGVRHTFKPTLSTGFGPDYSSERNQSRYFRTVETDLRPWANDTVTYGIFDEGNYGKPSMGSRRDLIVNFNILNVLEMKYFSRRDSTTKKFKIFDNLTFNGSFNASADSLKWSTISTGGLFRFFKGITAITWNAVFDPYIADAQGRRINRLVLDNRNRLLRTTALQIGINTSFSVADLRKQFSRQQTGATTTNQSLPNPDDFLGWLNQFRIAHRVGFERRLIPTGYGTARDTVVITSNNISVSGDIPISSNWRITIGNISYDFIAKQMVYPDLAFTRDLHCWEFRLSWQPLRGTYLFSINVKPSSLDFLKIPYRKNNIDARITF